MLWLAGAVGESLLVRPGLWWVWLCVLILSDWWQGESPSRTAHGSQEVVLALHRWSPAMQGKVHLLRAMAFLGVGVAFSAVGVASAAALSVAGV